MVKGRFHIAPMIVMTIDDLECLETSFCKYTLVDLLKAYSTTTPDRSVSLNNFMAGHPSQFPRYHSESLISGSKALCEESMRRVSPMKVDISINKNTAEKGGVLKACAESHKRLEFMGVMFNNHHYG